MPASQAERRGFLKRKKNPKPKIEKKTAPAAARLRPVPLGPKPEVFWSGFAFRGRDADISKRYPYTKEVNVSVVGETLFSKNFREFFKANEKAFRYVDFKFGLADADEGQTLAVALVMTEEQVLQSILPWVT